jgi:flagellar FliL protein
MAKKKKEAQSESDADADAEIENQEAEGEEGKAPSAKRKFPSFKLPSRKVLMMGGGGLAALIAIGGGGYYFFLSGHGNAHAAAAPAANVIKPVVFLDMPDVLVNLAGTAGDHTQYLKVKVTLELPDHAMEAQITPVMPRLMDTFQTYLRELRPTDLDGSAGLYRLKEELTRRVNAAIAPSKVNAVLFKEIVVQ